LVTKILVDIGSLGTAVGVIVTAIQLGLNRRQAVGQFEEGLTSRYRDLVRELPAGAFLDEEVPIEEIRKARGAFYRYFDLCNEQAFLNEEDRISEDTWKQWEDGIGSNMRRPAFRKAWSEEIEPKIGSDFEELRRVLARLDAGSREPRGSELGMRSAR
jgi:hypothetical protein